MRKLLVALAGLVTLAGCSLSVTGSLPTVHRHAGSYALHVAPAVAGAGAELVPHVSTGPPFQSSHPEHAASGPASVVIDLPQIARAAMHAPEEITLLKQTLLVAATAIVLAAILNAALLLRLLGALRGVMPTLPHGLALSNGPARPTSGATFGPAVARRRIAEVKRVAPVVLPERLIMPMLSGAVEYEEPERVTSAHLSHARIGQMRQYYIFDAD